MSDPIKHECGIVFLRLLKPLDFYKKKYGTSLYALNKMFLMMQKQVNRGQDGAGIVALKFDVPPGEQYIYRKRSVEKNAIEDIFQNIQKEYLALENKKDFNKTDWLKNNFSFLGETYLGHLRYGTYGKNNIQMCHPVVRKNNWKTKNLAVAGNFNLTNVDALLNQLVGFGQSPNQKTDTVTILEKIGHFTEEENNDLYYKYKKQGHSKKKISTLIEKNLNIKSILQESAKKWDGGYVISGLWGHGDAFVLRDPNGIRPVFYYKDQEVVVVTSERPVIQTAFNVSIEKIKEITRGSALIIKKNGKTFEEEILRKKRNKGCSFERIYFSRGNDSDIYKERKKLGKRLAKKVLESINQDTKNAVFSFIPNTAEISFYGLIESLQNNFNKKIRVEKIAIKDAKLRTFITDDKNRDGLVGHVYDITHGVVKKTDNLIVLDDSIVRGTTLKKSILKILARLRPKKIVIVSSAPQIRYPDCYGIDMAKLGKLIAFKAAISLLEKKKDGKKIKEEVYQLCKLAIKTKKEKVINHVQKIYQLFSAEEISEEVARLLKPKELECELQIVFQTIEDLHISCPNHTGDWYFTGNYPTNGGAKFVNKAFVYYIEGKNKRAY
ncbi:MAG: amidophosphoribosyltransferase [Flavobacteriales bacterium TMED113]|nr:MAG: amidophosphoribosyltransferase [Flavobacteriales bacterium TMED113]